jgi:hypothetical protein
MKVKEAIILFQYYQRSKHKKRTTASYLHLLKKFESLYGDRALSTPWKPMRSIISLKHSLKALPNPAAD